QRTRSSSSTISSVALPMILRPCSGPPETVLRPQHAPARPAESIRDLACLHADQPVVLFLDRLELTLDDVARVRRKTAFDRFLEGVDRCTVAPRRFNDDGVVGVVRENALQIYPLAVQGGHGRSVRCSGASKSPGVR